MVVLELNEKGSFFARRNKFSHWVLEEIITSLHSFLPMGLCFARNFVLGQLYLKLFGLSCFGLEG
jgi:hypothetical protein